MISNLWTRRALQSLGLVGMASAVWGGWKWWQGEVQVKPESSLTPARPKLSERKPPTPTLTNEEFAALSEFFVDYANVHYDDPEAILENLRKFRQLSRGQILVLADEAAARKPGYPYRGEMIDLLSDALRELARRDPASAIAYFDRPSPGASWFKLAEHALADVVEIWHEADPDSAYKWVEARINQKRGLIDARTLAELPGSLASRNPEGALTLARFQMDNGMRWDSVSIGVGVQEAGARSRLVEQIRKLKVEGSKSSVALARGAWTGLVNGLIQDSARLAVDWVDGAGFSPEERWELADEILAESEISERGIWAQWMSVHLDEKPMYARFQRLISSWAGRNHREAGAFIYEIQNPQAMSFAIESFVQTVARIDPAAAKAWAAALPDKTSRQEALRRIDEIPSLSHEQVDP